MADIDTSTYPKAVNKNPMDTLSSFATIQNQLNQNKLFQQQFNTNLAVSNIYKQAMKPDGTIDQGKLSQLLATDPNASYGLPQAYQNSQEAQQRNIGIDTSKLENAQKHINALNGYLTPLVTNPNATSSDVASTLSHAVTMGIASPQEAAGVYSTLPRDQQGKVDESKIKGWLQEQQFRLMTAQEQLNAMSPAPTAVDQGSQINLMRMPQVGQPSSAGIVQKGLPPTTPVFPAGGGQPAYAGAQPGPGGQGGGSFAANPPGFDTAASGVAQNSVKMGGELTSMADNVPARKALLGNLEGQLNQFTSGPGADWKRVAKAMTNANSPFGAIFDPKSIASQEEFNKQSFQLAQAQFQALGGTGTDAKLDSAMHTSPNEALSSMGNHGIIAMLKGNEDAIATKNRAWQAYQQQHGPQSYGQFSADFNKAYDPRVFQFQYLTAGDRKKELSGMSKGEQKGFLNSYRAAINNGWVSLPGGQ